MRLNILSIVARLLSAIAALLEAGNEFHLQALSTAAEQIAATGHSAADPPATAKTKSPGAPAPDSDHHEDESEGDDEGDDEGGGAPRPSSLPTAAEFVYVTNRNYVHRSGKFHLNPRCEGFLLAKSPIITII